MRLGEGHLPVLVGVGDLYLELTSAGVRGRRVVTGVVALFLSDGTRRRLVVVSVATSIQALMKQTCIDWIQQLMHLS